MSDLRARWRRSFFGIFWSILQPLGLTLLLSLVFSRVLGQPLGLYAPYILSGVIVWEYVVTTAISGSLAFVQADAYIKQTRHPLAIYTLRNAITGAIVLATASTSLFAWVLIVAPENFGWCWLAVITVLPIAVMAVWPLATIMAYIATRFRDLPHALGLILQALYFVSPIYFKPEMFRKGGLGALVDYNPVYHLLQLVRAPLLAGQWPAPADYLWCFAGIAALAGVALLVGWRSERTVIFFL